ncbi:hypothetical protein [Micromonospora sp. NPDC002717]
MWDIVSAAPSSAMALVGFGLDSFIEVSSAAVLIWQCRCWLP